jgi:hypothetical protein
MNVVSGRHQMTQYPYILFNKSPEQLRRLGALGGKAYGRNQRARRALLTTPPLPREVLPCAIPQKTAAQSIHVLDARFPWLRGAEKPLSRNPGWRASRLHDEFSGSPSTK